DPTRLAERPDFVVVDTSFISLKLVLPAAFALARTPGHLLALIKPQFEAGRRYAKKGIARDPLVHTAVCDDIAAFVRSLGWAVPGGDGNRSSSSQPIATESRVSRLSVAIASAMVPRHDVAGNHHGGHARSAAGARGLARRDRRNGQARVAHRADPTRPDRHDD